MFFTFWYQDVLVLLYTSLYLAKNLKGTGLAYCFLSLERVKITRNWNFHLKTKHVFSLLVTFDVDACSNRKKVNFRVQYFVFWFIQILKLCKSLFYSRFWYKNSVGKCDLTYKKFRRVVFQRLLMIQKSIITEEYQYQYSCFILIFHI